MSNEDRQTYLKAYKAQYKKRTKQVNITLSEKEYQAFEKRAKKEGVKVTTLIKNMAIAYEQQAPIFTPEHLQEMQEMRFIFRNVANNINQIAHHSNTIKRLADENGLLLEIKKLEDIVLNHYVKPK